MTEQAREALKELQHLDNQIADAEEKVRAFEENGIAVAKRPIDIASLIQSALA